MLKKLLLLALVFCLTGGADANAESLKPREIQVIAAVSPGFKSLPDWRAHFERRLAYASRIFESEFKIKFKLVQYIPWTPADETAGIEDLLEELRLTVPLTQSDMVIGLLHWKNAPPEKMKDLHTIGQARPFTGHLVVRYPANKLYQVQEETTLVHELGHAFGAIHTEDTKSIMAPIMDKQLPSKFDPQNRNIILQTRMLNFRSGAESLPASILQTLLTSYLKMIKQNKSADFFYSIGLFYLQLGQTEDAVKAWKAAVQVAPQNAEMRYNLGMLYYKNGKDDLARPHLSQAAAGLKHASQKQTQAEALTALGSIYFQQDNMFAAYGAWTRALAVRPKDLELKANLALVKMKQGQTSEAIRDLQEVIRQDPRHFKALRALGSGLAQQGQSEEGLKYLELALTILNQKPRGAAQAVELSAIYAEIAQIYLKTGDQNRALQYFRTACDMAPSAECRKQLGMALFQTGQWDAAAQELAAAVQGDPTNADLYGLLGTALTQKNDLTNAIGVFREGLRYAKAPAMQARLHRNLGHIFVTMKRYDMAEPEFRMALAKDGSDQDSHFGLAVVLLSQNQLKGAAESLRQVLRINPRHDQAEAMLNSVEAKLQGG